MKKDKSDLPLKNSDVMSELADPHAIELGRRIGAVLGLYKTRKHAAVVAGVHVDSLYRYMRGEQSPTFDVMTKLCNHVGVSLQWLATGEPPMLVGNAPSGEAEGSKATPPRIQPDISEMSSIIATVEALLEQMRYKAPPELKAELIASIYAASSAQGGLDNLAEILKRSLDLLHQRSA